MNRLARSFELGIQAIEVLQPRLREMALGGLVERLRQKDHSLVGHSHRVTFFADLLAHRLQLPPEEIETVRSAAFLHDIGKLEVAREILLKPGKLDADQHRAMRQHPALGLRILRDLSLPQRVLSGILHHHEWWNGSGYPHGLSAQAIPLPARIIAVCDAFDSMSSDRVYRRARSRTAIVDEFRRFSGIQFEASLVREFLLILDTGVCDAPLPASSAPARLH